MNFLQKGRECLGLTGLPDTTWKVVSAFALFQIGDNVFVELHSDHRATKASKLLCTIFQRDGFFPCSAASILAKKDATNEVKAINVTLQPFAKELNFRFTFCAKIPLFVFTKIKFRRNPILRKLKSQKIDFCKLCLKRNWIWKNERNRR